MVGFRSEELAATGHSVLMADQPIEQAAYQPLFVAGYIALLLALLTATLLRGKSLGFWRRVWVFLFGMAIVCCGALQFAQLGIVQQDYISAGALQNVSGFLAIAIAIGVSLRLYQSAKAEDHQAREPAAKISYRETSRTVPSAENGRLFAVGSAPSSFPLTRHEDGPLSLSDALAGTGITLYARDREMAYHWICNPTWADKPNATKSPSTGLVLPPFEDKLAALHRAALEQSRPVRGELSIGSGDEQRWFELNVQPGILSNGSPGTVGLIADVTKYRDQEAAFRLHMQETTHRAKNLLAVVQSIARLSVKSLALPNSVADVFTARIQALASAHDLLVREDWQGISLADLVANQINQLTVGSAASRVEHMGPRLLLRPTAVQTLALALHELAENSAKYGSLSAAGGRVIVSWEAAQMPDCRPGYRLIWQESGGPVVRPPIHRGFGYEILERLTPRGLRGDAQSFYLPDGYRWELYFPQSNIEPAAEHATGP